MLQHSITSLLHLSILPIFPASPARRASFHLSFFLFNSITFASVIMTQKMLVPLKYFQGIIVDMADDT